VIFISYRRSDASGYAGRLCEDLEARLGRGSVFQDVEAIEPGTNFSDAINTAVGRCRALVVLIGDTWLTDRSSDGGMRLQEPADFVRLEVASALRAGKPVLPVLIEGARMPSQNALPEDLWPLAQLQALELSDSRWDYDVGRLASALQALTGGNRVRRRRLALAAGVIALAGAGAAFYGVLSRPVDVSGRWNLPTGSYWSVIQDGRNITVDETHYQSKQVWKRGQGAVHEDRLRFRLNLVYGARHYEGTVKLSRDAKMLTGEVRDVESGATEPLTLTR
jgi:hypothetical protein